MRPGRELDTAIARQVFNHEVFIKKRIPYEKTPKGERPLLSYSREIQAAWQVVEKMNITVIPIEDGMWFALVGTGNGWKSPADFLEYLHSGNFANSGAAVDLSAPLSICMAAMKALESRAIDTPASQPTSRTHH